MGGTGVLYLGRAGTLASSAYTYNLNGGTLWVPQISRTAGTGNTSSGIFNFNGGTLKASKANATWMQGLTSANMLDGGANIDDGGFAVTIAQNIDEGGSGLGVLTKTGTGTLTLTGTSTYFGPTVVNAGTMVLGGTGQLQYTSGITINGGAKFVKTTTAGITPTVTIANGTLDGVGMSSNNTGVISNVIVADSATNVIANGNGGTGVLSIDSLTFNGKATLNLNTASIVDPVLLVTYGLTTSGGPITVNATRASWDIGTVYNLIGYGSWSGSIAEFTKGTVTGLTPRQDAVLSNPSGFISLTISAKPGGGVPVWTDALNNGQWTADVQASPKNWQLQPGGLPTDFIPTDSVLFNDTAIGSTAVDIFNADVVTTSATFNNSTKNYTLSSAGGFGISAGYVVKSGSGALTINNANTYAGGTILNAGTLNINNAAGIGTGALTINGGTLDNTTGAAITLGTTVASVFTPSSAAQNWNGDFAFTGTQNLNLGTGAVTLGGTAGSRTVTVNAGTLTAGSIPVATPGYGLTKAGAGTLAFGSATSRIDGDLNVAAGILQIGANDFYATGITGTGTIENGSGTTRWVYINNAADVTFAGVLRDGTGGGRLGLNKTGTGKLTISNTTGNTFTDAVTVQQGTLVFSGVGNNVSAVDNVGTLALANAVLEIAPGATFNAMFPNGGGVWNASINIGTVAGAAGSVKMYDATSTFNVARQLTVGGTSFGAYSQSAGTSTIGGFIAAGGTTGGGIVNLSGGTMTLTAAPITVGYVTSGTMGVMNVSGAAALNLNGGAGNGLWIGEQGNAILNVSGTSTITIPNDGIIIGKGNGTAQSPIGIVNLNGGTVTVRSVSMTATAGTSIINLNGSTLKANGSSTTFMQGLTSAYIYSGGVTIDDGGNNITVGQSLLAPTTGSGVSAAGLTVSGGGYIDTPIVQVVTSETNAIGATAVATIDSLGNLTGITMTNPGVGYTIAPSFNLLGGGNGATGLIGGTASLVTNSSGKLTKTGAGSLTLSGVNTYTGGTTVNNGILQAAMTASLPDYTTAGKVQVATGATLAVNVGGATEWTATDVNTLHGSATFAAGSFIGMDTTNATGSFIYSNAITGNKGLKKLGTNVLVLDTTSTYTGATIVNNGTLELLSTGQIASSSGVSTTATTATFQVNGGSHTVGTISGIGTTNVAAGNLTAAAIGQGSLIVGAGANATSSGTPVGYNTTAITTTAADSTFFANGGTHIVGAISGLGVTTLADNTNLTANSIDQSVLTIGAGATVTIAPIAGGPLSGAGSLSTVPEPSTWAMLIMAVMGLGMYWRRSR